VLLSIWGAEAWHDPLVPLLLLLAVLAVLAAIAVVAAGRGGSMSTSAPDRSPLGELPVDDVDRAAVDGLRFSLAFRGYRMDEVDGVLDRLSSEIETRDRRIAELEGRGVPPAPGPGEEADATAAEADAADAADASNEV
jgi:DivIVA domain-containing protein